MKQEDQARVLMHDEIKTNNTVEISKTYPHQAHPIIPLLKTNPTKLTLCQRQPKKIPLPALQARATRWSTDLLTSSIPKKRLDVKGQISIVRESLAQTRDSHSATPTTNPWNHQPHLRPGARKEASRLDSSRKRLARTLRRRLPAMMLRRARPWCKRDTRL
jgi:hypothetical protein